MNTQSAGGNMKLSENISMATDGSSASDLPTVASGYEKAHSSSDQNAKNQPEVDSESKVSSGGHEREHTLSEDPAAMTIEFLRARLSSERAISKTARQQTELLAKKVMELERILQAEMERRRLSQLAAEQALSKLQSAGVPLDSTQLDIFVREFDARKEALSYQHRESIAVSESCVTSSLNLGSVHSTRTTKGLASNQNNNSGKGKPHQNPERPLSNATNSVTDRTKNAADNPEELGESEGISSKISSPANESLRLIPVRGVGRSCRTFRKRHTSEPLLDSWNVLGEDAVESPNKEEQESREFSGWVNHVVDMFDGNSRKNSSSSSESEWTDIGQSDPPDFENQKDQHSLVEGTNKAYKCDASEVRLPDPTHGEIPAEQKVPWEQHMLENTSTQEEAMRNQNAGFTPTFQAENPGDRDMPICSTENEATEKRIDVSSESPTRLKDLQCIEGAMTSTAEQFQFSSSGINKATCVLVHTEETLAGLSHLAEKSHELLANASADPLNSALQISSDSSVVVTNDLKGSGCQSEHQVSKREDVSGDGCMVEEDEAYPTPFQFPTEVKNCTMDSTADGEKVLMFKQRSMGCSQETFQRSGHSQPSYGSHFNESTSHETAVDSRGVTEREMFTKNWTGENSWVAVPSKADLQRQALHSTGVVESSQNFNTRSSTLANSKMMEFPQHFADYREENDKNFWKPSSSGGIYKDALNRGHALEHAAGTIRGRPTRTSIYQDQPFLQNPSHSDRLLSGGSAGMQSETSIKYQRESDYQLRMKEIHPTPYSLELWKQQRMPENSRIEFLSRSSDERAREVLLALRHAKAQLKESIEQEKRFPHVNAALSEDFQTMLGARDLSHNHDFRNLTPGHFLMQQKNELRQRGRDFGIPRFYNPEHGLPNVSMGYRQLPLTTATELVPYSHQPASSSSNSSSSSYVEKLNVGKGIEFFFRR